LVLSRFFGIFPITGAWPTTDVEKVTFKWLTLPVLSTAVMMGFATLDVCLTFRMMSEQGLKLTTTGPLSFSIECLSAFIVFLCLSRNWPNLIKSTRRLENIFSQHLYTCKESKKFSQRIRFLGWMFLFCSVIEHSFYVSSGIYSNYLQIKQCNLTVNFWHNYYVRERLQIFSLVSYTVWLVPLLQVWHKRDFFNNLIFLKFKFLIFNYKQWITISMTFVWNFIDIFLILTCRGLAIRFRQFDWCIKCHIKKNMPNDFWLKRRQDFLTLSDLFQQYDDKLSNLVLLSSAQNMYFMASHIFYIFHLTRENFMMDIYFWFSFAFVAFRSFYMMLTASRIHDTTNDIIASMYEIPTAHWCLELKRLNEVIVSDLFAISGRGFFFITRRLMLAVCVVRLWNSPAKKRLQWKPWTHRITGTSMQYWPCDR
ncbi:putative gustatory receptor 64c, partial [Lucilia cuprina]